MRSFIALCQCPKRATYHFYAALIVIWPVSNKECVNALSGLHIISTTENGHMMNILKICVNALSGLHIISTLPLQKWHISAIFQGWLCRYFSEYSDKCCLGILFRACSYFSKYPNLNKPAFIPNPGPIHDIACISAPKHPDKSSSRLPTAETTHMRSAGIHTDR